MTASGGVSPLVTWRRLRAWPSGDQRPRSSIGWRPAFTSTRSDIVRGTSPTSSPAPRPIRRRGRRRPGSLRLRRLAYEPLEDRRLLALSASGMVWKELTADGVRNPGESGVPGAVIEVFSSADAVVGNADDVSQGTATTDAAGQYEVSELSNGVNYYLLCRPPVGLTFTAAQAGLDTTHDSDANASGVTPMFTLAGSSRTDLDAGLVGAAPGFGFAVGVGAAGVAGATNTAAGQSVATDAAGNVYVTGYFRDTIDCDPGPGTYALTSAGGSDMLVAKYTAAGALVWARDLGGSGDDQGRGLAVAANGNVYVTGVFLGTADFDPGSGTYALTSAGNGTQQNTVVFKLGAAGHLLWARAIGGDSVTGSSNAQSSDIAVAADGSAYTTGSFQGTVDFDPGATSFDVGSVGFSDIFVSKLDVDGNFVWAQTLGGTSAYDQGHGVAVAPDGSVVTTGVFLGTTDFDPGSNTFPLTSAGDCDVFVSKLDASGNFLWARALGGAAYDGGSAVAVASDGAVSTTGVFFGTADFDPGAGTFNLTSAGNSDIFVSQLDAAGNFRWARAVGGPGYDYGNGLTVGTLGDVYTTGSFSGTVDFDPGAGTSNLTAVGGTDSQAAFASRLDAAGNFVRASALGGTSHVDHGRDIAVASDGSMYTTGGFAGTADFDPGAGLFALTAAGSDASLFVSRLTQNSSPTALTLSTSSVAQNSNSGTPIGTFTTTDPNLVDSFTYTLVVGTGDADNASFAITGNLLQTAGSLTTGTKSSYSIRVRSTDAGGLSYEQAFSLAVILPPWQNSANPLDVDQGGDVRPLDVLIIINYLNTHAAGALPPPGAAGPPPFLDVSGDSAVTALDVLLIINYLNNRPTTQAAQAEGEASWTMAAASDRGNNIPSPINPTERPAQLQFAAVPQRRASPLPLSTAGTRTSAAGRMECAVSELSSSDWDDLLGRLAD